MIFAFFCKDYNLANYVGNTTSDIMNDIFEQINISEKYVTDLAFLRELLKILKLVF